MSYIPWPEEEEETAVQQRSDKSTFLSSFAFNIALAFAAVVSGSSGPTWFKLMGTEPITFVKVYWRMSGTALVQIPLALWQLSYLDRDSMRSTLSKLPWRVIPVGVLFSLHFVCVAFSVSSTSFAHSIATINTAPLFFTAFI